MKLSHYRGMIVLAMDICLIFVCNILLSCQLI